jgi:hypothetical protein
MGNASAEGSKIVMPEALLNQLPMGRIRDSKASAEITVAFGLQGVFQWSHSQIPEVEKS